MIQMALAAYQALSSIGQAYSNEAYRKISDGLRKREAELKQKVAIANADAANALTEARNTVTAANVNLTATSKSLQQQSEMRKLGDEHDAAVRTLSRFNASATAAGLGRSLQAAGEAGALRTQMAARGVATASTMLANTLNRQTIMREAMAQETAAQQRYELKGRVSGLEAAYQNPAVLSIQAQMEHAGAIPEYVDPFVASQSSLGQDVGGALFSFGKSALQAYGEYSRSGGTTQTAPMKPAPAAPAFQMGQSGVISTNNRFESESPQSVAGSNSLFAIPGFDTGYTFNKLTIGGRNARRIF